MKDPKNRKVGIFVVDEEFKLTSWDQGMEQLTGIPKEEAEGRLLTEIVPEPIASSKLQRLKKAMEEGSPEVLSPALHRYLIKSPPPHGAKYYDHMRQKVTITPILGEDGTKKAIVTVEDVTLRMEWERDMAKALKEGDEETRVRAAEELSLMSETPSDYLMESLGDESWRVRQVAIKGLSQRVSREVTRDLLRMLKKEHANIRALNSVLHLLSLCQEDVTETLLEFLSDTDPELRSYTAMLMGQRKDPSAIPHLILALKDPDKNVVYHAIEALGRLGAYEASEALVELATSGDFFLAFPAIEALSEIGNPDVVPRLIPLLGDPMLSSVATEALGALGGPETVPELVALLNHRRISAFVVSDAILAIHTRCERRVGDSQIPKLVSDSIQESGITHLLEALKDRSLENKGAVITLMGWIKSPKMVDALISTLISVRDSETTKQVVQALVNLGDITIQGILGSFKDMDLQGKKAASMVLGTIGSKDAVPVLLEELNMNPEQDELIQVIAGALAKIGDRRAFEPLLRFLGHEDPGVRLSVIGALNSIGHPEMGSRMKSYLKDPDPIVRSSALTIAGYFGYPECLEEIISCTRDPVVDVRRVAVEQLPYLEDPKAIEALKTALSDEAPEVRASAVKAIAEVETGDKQGVLSEKLKDESPMVRFYALKGIAKNKIPLIDQLCCIAVNDPAPHVRIMAICALGELKDERALKTLKVLSDEKDVNISSAALEALGHFSDPSVYQMLRQKVLDRPFEDRQKRLSAVKAVSCSQMKEKVYLLHSVASTDEDDEIIKEAVLGLGTIPEQEAIMALLDLAQKREKRDLVFETLCAKAEELFFALEGLINQTSKGMKLVLVELLLRYKTYAATEVLRHLLYDRDWEVRKAVCEAIGELGSQRLGKALMSIKEQDHVPQVRAAADKALRMLAKIL